MNKYGRSSNVDSGVDTDIWDAAAQPVWLAPTGARNHAIVSGSADDDQGGTGATTVRVYGLETWDSKLETNELVSLTGVTPVDTANDYVIIHRMVIESWGSGGTNAGLITATAEAPDSTVTAQIAAGMGQTHMAIFGLSSKQNLRMYGYYASIVAPASGNDVLVKLAVNPKPDVLTTGFISKHINGLHKTGSSWFGHRFSPEFIVNGPAIIKVIANGDAANMDVMAGFDGDVLHEAG